MDALRSKDIRAEPDEVVSHSGFLAYRKDTVVQVWHNGKCTDAWEKKSTLSAIELFKSIVDGWMG